MKTNDLRATLLVLLGTLLTVFVLSMWYVSRQAQALQKIRKETVATKDALALAKSRHDLMSREMAELGAMMHQMERKMYAQPAQYPKGLLGRAKLGFNDIQHLVAKGEFSGLALTDGYTELQQIFDNPAFEEMLASDHGPLAPQ